MSEKNLFFCIFSCCLLLSSCERVRTEAQEARAAAKTESANKDEVVLSAEQQASVAIETQPAMLSAEPDLLRAKGRIALADDRTWRVGVRTQGMVVMVYAGLGDRVHKGQVLARYHADEVRDSRAQYRAALAELDRAKAAAAQAQRNRDRAQRLWT